MTRNHDKPELTTLSSRIVYQNPYMRVREDRIRRLDSSEGIYSYFDKPDFAVIIPYENNGFHIVEQYRYPIRRRSWEFPEGTLPNLAEPEDYRDLAAKELQQETGLTANSLEFLGRLDQAPGNSNQKFQIFLTTNLIGGMPDRELEEQDMRQHWVEENKFTAMIKEGVIHDSCTIAAYMLFRLSSTKGA